MKKYTPGLLLAGAGLLYFIWIRVTGIMIPCPFRAVTGIRCPGCGITTMLLCLSKGDLRAAFDANPFLLVTSPYLAFLLIHSFRQRFAGYRKESIWVRRSEIVYLILLLAFGVIRGVRDLQLIL